MTTAGAATEYGRFDFGLSPDQEQRAQRLHESSVIVDLHFQGPCSPDVWTDELVAELEQEIAAREPGARGDDLDYSFGFLLEKALRGEFPL